MAKNEEKNYCRQSVRFPQIEIGTIGNNHIFFIIRNSVLELQIHFNH